MKWHQQWIVTVVCSAWMIAFTGLWHSLSYLAHIDFDTYLYVIISYKLRPLDLGMSYMNVKEICDWLWRQCPHKKLHHWGTINIYDHCQSAMTSKLLFEVYEAPVFISTICWRHKCIIVYEKLIICSSLPYFQDM